MDEVGEGPDHGHAGEWDAEQDDVQQADAQDVGQPHPSAVHHARVGVHLAVSRAHVHDAAAPTRRQTAGETPTTLGNKIILFCFFANSILYACWITESSLMWTQRTQFKFSPPFWVKMC